MALRRCSELPVGNQFVGFPQIQIRRPVHFVLTIPFQHHSVIFEVHVALGRDMGEAERVAH